MQVKIELNRAGIVELLKSKGVQDDLTRRGENIANAAGPEDYASRTWVGFDRARNTVAPTTYKGRRDEAVNKRLTSSIDAARR
jgi:hypothetical protein